MAFFRTLKIGWPGGGVEWASTLLSYSVTMGVSALSCTGLESNPPAQVAFIVTTKRIRHTLSWCPAWVFERVALKRALGMEEDIELPLPTVIGEALKSREAWSALSTFAKTVLLQKEVTERERERQPPAGVDFGGDFNPP